MDKFFKYVAVLLIANACSCAQGAKAPASGGDLSAIPSTIEWRGEWCKDKLYLPGDAVSRGGQVFVAVARTKDQEPVFPDPKKTPWQILSRDVIQVPR